MIRGACSWETTVVVCVERVPKDRGAEGFSCRFMSQVFVLSYRVACKEGPFGEPSEGGAHTS